MKNIKLRVGRIFPKTFLWNSEFFLFEWEKPSFTLQSFVINFKSMKLFK